jgi:hypothetical protein
MMELTTKQTAWLAYKEARRTAGPIKPTPSVVVHAPEGSMPRAIRRAAMKLAGTPKATRRNRKIAARVRREIETHA